MCVYCFAHCFSVTKSSFEILERKNSQSTQDFSKVVHNFSVAGGVELDQLNLILIELISKNKTRKSELKFPVQGKYKM